jgi:hypothetical protein
MNEELWHAFDRIKAGLDKQERLRSTPAFGEWCMTALSQFSKYLDLVDAWDDASPGGLLCEWQDWMDARGLAWRGTPKWKIPMGGPLNFYPPTMAMVMDRSWTEVVNLNLKDGHERYKASLAELTTATRGEGGRKKGKKSRPKK